MKTPPFKPMAFPTEGEAFSVASAYMEALKPEKRERRTFRVVMRGMNYHVMIVPKRGDGMPYYL